MPTERRAEMLERLGSQADTADDIRDERYTAGRKLIEAGIDPGPSIISFGHINTTCSQLSAIRRALGVPIKMVGMWPTDSDTLRVLLKPVGLNNISVFYTAPLRAPGKCEIVSSYEKSYRLVCESQ